MMSNNTVGILLDRKMRVATAHLRATEDADSVNKMCGIRDVKLVWQEIFYYKISSVSNS
jgi:hypothetical protein